MAIETQITSRPREIPTGKPTDMALEPDTIRNLDPAEEINIKQMSFPA